MLPQGSRTPPDRQPERPVAFIAYLPAAVITGRVAGSGVPGWLALASPAAGLVLFTAARMLWNWALKRYESIGG